ncbi:histidine phosphatase family protein [Bacillus sp. DTU_2020_1000418_1_SI_GHA_SEK_038]|uniref:histidine phosphatase family protein n=1 Tax=Bacillus sp. DTU_2020_1000418_1_SI_GHA_SEK_038 TaxID=3077585 RepID=UPI0028E663EE|nr:histidine phosphatase family protein [Bacillus sp. DTU_2020_1000418_1_SI_GHA_SEK_038]WNS74983.1 histidine phosphatase family protein [Bacillus sp. DTU_2020_1000418_1_SI_GHA_SEK_038]
MTHLYFVRHAHSTYTPDELGRPLSKRGFVDAYEITEILKVEQIDIVISSPYSRAVQTVEAAANYFNREIEIVEGFRERKLTSGPVEDFTFAITKVWEDESFSWEGGESNAVAQKRGVAATFQILDKYEGKNIVIGTHGNIMVLIMNYFDQQYDFLFWKKLDMPDIYKLTFDGRELRNVTRLWKTSG